MAYFRELFHLGGRLRGCSHTPHFSVSSRVFVSVLHLFDLALRPR
jgi:hypothetical protein